MTIRSFLCADTEALYEDRKPGRFRNIETVAQRKLQMLEDAVDLRDLASPPGNRLEALKDDRKGQHSIRINLKTAIQATENTENTEMKRVPHIFSAHLMGEADIYGNQLFLLCELCVLCG